MRSFTLVAVLVPLLLAVGCKRAKPTEAANPEIAKVKPAPQLAPKNDKKTEKELEPNWLKTPLGGNKDQNQLSVDTPVNGGGKLPSVTTPQGGVTVPPVQPPGTGVLQPNPEPNKPPAGGTTTVVSTKTVTKDDMFHVQIFIHDSSLVTGRMPAPALTYAALIKAESPAAELVKDGAIILTTTTQRDSIWAFEARAYLNGGFVVSQNGVETLTASELKKRLGK